MKIKNLIIILALLLTSCSNFIQHESNSFYRIPASTTDELTHQLYLDKFLYYVTEYSVAMEGKVPEEVIHTLRKMTYNDVVNLHLTSNQLASSNNYDEILFNYLKELKIVTDKDKSTLKWNYNFFRTKLDEAFILTPSKLKINLKTGAIEDSAEREINVEKVLYTPEEMTLDSGHYISNRTTRAIFWEANESGRTIEFHLGDSREFLKTLTAQGGEIISEVRPLAKNYNKIFVIKYKNEESFRYAITNIGGADRLNHLTNQLSLSNLQSGKPKAKVVVKGDLIKFQNARTEEHIQQLKHLPFADRVIIGQKESIDGKFNIFWKMQAINQLKENNPSQLDHIDSTLIEKYNKLNKASFESIFKDKKIVEDIFASLEDYFTNNPSELPEKFKIYNYDNFTIEMCDYVFKGPEGKTIRWRVVSNVWGDEIVSIAKAFKATGHTNVTYMGTAGAFAGKGIKVGDLVIPTAVVDHDKKIPVKANIMKIDGAKIGGSVEHVGSPFEETKEWLAKTSARSEFVEVETSYLRQIFNGAQDNLELYLLISDILGSETETLANATSAKRKNSQNKLLAELFKRDAKTIPAPVYIKAPNKDVALKTVIDEILAKKGAAYRYLVYSQLRNEANVSEKVVANFAERVPAFSDAFIIDRLVETGEVIAEVKRVSGIDFKMGIDKNLIDGTYSPKTDILNLAFVANNDEDMKKISATLEKVLKDHAKLKPTLKFEVVKGSASFNMAITKVPDRIDADLLVKAYTYAGMANAGLYRNVTYNGSLTLDFLPTEKQSNPMQGFWFFKGTAADKLGGVPLIQNQKCMDLINDFFKTLH